MKRDEREGKIKCFGGDERKCKKIKNLN